MTAERPYLNEMELDALTELVNLGVSNAVQFVIATNGGPVGIGQLPYTPPTNTYSALTNVLGFVPATNGGPVAIAQLPYTPPTNSYQSLTNVLGFVPGVIVIVSVASRRVVVVADRSDCRGDHHHLVRLCRWHLQAQPSRGVHARRRGLPDRRTDRS